MPLLTRYYGCHVVLQCLDVKAGSVAAMGGEIYGECYDPQIIGPLCALFLIWNCRHIYQISFRITVKWIVSRNADAPLRTSNCPVIQA